jgi:hypothetical protein
MTAVSIFRAIREIGWDPRRFKLLAQVPKYFRHLNEWKKRGGRVSGLYPILSDWSDQAGSASGAYFHQDLLVARRIFEARPARHIDVGSRIDGFVAHVAVFREIEVVDIRPLQNPIRNVRFLQEDLMKGSPALEASTDSLSCLHALEHFGLGRYGDPVDPQGHLRGFQSLVKMLKPNATFYLSFPIGKPVVEFNAHRVFKWDEVLTWPGSELLSFQRFDLIDDMGALHENVPIDSVGDYCADLVQGCGIFTFYRIAP